MKQQIKVLRQFDPLRNATIQSTAGLYLQRACLNTYLNSVNLSCCKMKHKSKS